MNLRTKLFTVLVVGTTAFVLSTAVMRGMIERRNARVQTRASAEFAAEDGFFDTRRFGDSLVVQLTSWTRIASDEVLSNRALDAERSKTHSVELAYWKELVTASKLDAKSTMALLEAGGDVIGIDGPYASDPAGFAKALRDRGLAGRGGARGIRSGLFAVKSSVEVGASLGISTASIGRRTAAADVPGTDYRVVLIRPFDMNKTAARVPGTTLDIYDLGDADLSESLQATASELWRTDGQITKVNDDGSTVLRAIQDAAGRSGFLLVAHSGSKFAGLIPAGLQESLIWELLAATCAIVIAMRFTYRRVLRPLEDLESHASRLARTEHGTLAFHSSDRGEIGRLASALDSMLHKIQSDRSEFVRSARIAGMSDVSMGVVHSAGNILNSVNVSTQLLAKEFSALGIADLRAMITELEEHKEDLGIYVTEDPNGQFLIPFLSAMTESLDDLRTRCLMELESVDHGVAHVIDLIRSQERYAIGASVVEATSIAGVVDMAVNIASLANERSSEILIDRSYAEIPEVVVDKHKLTSVLINIVSNAIEALTVDSAREQRLELSIYPMTADRFVIEVTDTGIGIAPENLDVIFNSTFTTKAHATGQGLHTTANLCKEMGIAIGAVSEGIGCGTTVKLRVPFESPMREGAQRDVEDPRAALPATGEVPSGVKPPRPGGGDYRGPYAGPGAQHLS